MNLESVLKMSFHNKLEELKSKIIAQVSSDLSVTGEFNGSKWQFLVEYSESFKMTDDVRERIKYIAQTVDYGATCYILPMES